MQNYQINFAREAGLKITLFLALLLVYQIGNSQNRITGKVVAPNQDAIIGANIYWSDTEIGTTTDENGNFELTRENNYSVLVASFVGYLNDTIRLAENQNHVLFALTVGLLLDQVSITEKQGSTFISNLKTIKTEMVTVKELRKAACCNLSESFQTNTSVEIGEADAVSGAKNVRMLGLDGAYVQMLTEGIPTLRGLASTYGLNYIPGPWMDAIAITKGSGSVTNGYEPITGQINVEYMKPEKADRLYLNFYANHMGRLEGNLNLAHRFTDQWSTMALLHVSGLNNKVDHNDDHFLDMPKYKQFSCIQRWKYHGEKLESMFGVKLLSENKIGGQLAYNPDIPRTIDNGYGIGINTKRIEAFAKTGFFLPEPNSSIGTMVSGIYHQQNAFFGLKEYEGIQKNLYINLLYQTIIGSTDHQITSGFSFMHDDYDETFNQVQYQRTENVPGIFTEYSYNLADKMSLVSGLRADYHNLYGFMLNPRIHWRYDLFEQGTIRASVGRGMRVANIFAQNMSIFASSRELVIQEALNPEVAWNYGLNYTQNFTLFDRDGFVTFDAYRTDFTNQVIADAYSTSNLLQIYNLNGKSFANSFQIEMSHEVLKKVDVKMAYKFDDARSTFGGQLLQVPLQAQHKALFNIAYETLNSHWRFDFTTQWHGPRYLFNTLLDNGTQNLKPEKSPSYFILHTQATYILRNFEIYLGGENLTGFTQHHPILAHHQPFGEEFDATNIWGPIVGRMFYTGIRFKLPYPENQN
ncbi:MAG: TonB-dependent receptor [Sphingobacteriales bacterium]|nr:MAG: TonB-dependent receptor [Sphingobacteriales bacterium]